MSLNDNTRFLKNIQKGIKITIYCSKSGSEITKQTRSNNLSYLIDPTFKNIKGWFVLSFKNGNDDPTRNYFGEYYMPLVEIKDFNGLINIF